MKVPYTFDGPYSSCYEYRPGAIDERHVYLIHEVLTQWQFKSALEIGCFNGASSTAFVEALNDECLSFATFCDVMPRASLRCVLDNCGTDNYRLVTQPSWEVLEGKADFDFILVDGSHDIDSVAYEMERLLPRKPLCIMAHDTRATQNGYPKCEGAESLRLTLEGMKDYYCIEDAVAREGEETQRGLFLATRSADLFKVAKKAFAKWAAWNPKLEAV